MSNTSNNNTNQNTTANAVSDNSKPTTESNNSEPSLTGFTRTITTSLKGKKELFRLMSLAESTQLPLLFVGEPGIGKTAAVSDYSKSKINGKDHNEEVFFIEVNEDTRPSALTGTIDHKALYEKGEFKRITRVPKSDVIVINEVDKAQSGFRNGCLSIMNEKKLYYGDSSVDCNWKLYVATCNKIPTEEKGNHFWDRFILTYEVKRLSSTNLVKVASEGLKESNINIFVPSAEDIENVNIPDNKIKEFIKNVYDSVSDRTAIRSIYMAKAIKLIWGCSINKALIKATSLIAGDTAAKILSNKLQTEVMTELINDFQAALTLRDSAAQEEQFININNKCQNYIKQGKLSEEEYNEFIEIFKKEISQ